MSEEKETKGYKELMQAVYFEPETIVKDEELYDLHQQDRIGHAWTVLDFYEEDELTSAEIDAGISLSPCNTISEITELLGKITKLLPLVSSQHLSSVAEAIEMMNDPESKSMSEGRTKSKNAKKAADSRYTNEKDLQKNWKEFALIEFENEAYKWKTLTEFMDHLIDTKNVPRSTSTIERWLPKWADRPFPIN